MGPWPSSGRSTHCSRGGGEGTFQPQFEYGNWEKQPSFCNELIPSSWRLHPKSFPKLHFQIGLYCHSENSLLLVHFCPQRILKTPKSHFIFGYDILKDLQRLYNNVINGMCQMIYIQVEVTFFQYHLSSCRYGVGRHTGERRGFSLCSPAPHVTDAQFPMMLHEFFHFLVKSRPDFS